MKAANTFVFFLALLSSKFRLKFKGRTFNCLEKENVTLN